MAIPYRRSALIVLAGRPSTSDMLLPLGVAPTGHPDTSLIRCRWGFPPDRHLSDPESGGVRCATRESFGNRAGELLECLAKLARPGRLGQSATRGHGRVDRVLVLREQRGGPQP